MKVSYSGSSATNVNSFLSTSLTHLIVGRAFLVMEVLHRSFQPKKSISALLKMKKSIPRTTSGLILVTKKFSLKNFTRFALSITKKAEITILKMSSIMPLIFCTPMSISLIRSPSFWVKVR